jgi:hypothetical protein
LITVSGSACVSAAVLVLVLVLPASGAVTDAIVSLLSTPRTCRACRQHDGHEDKERRSDPEHCSSLHGTLSPYGAEEFRTGVQNLGPGEDILPGQSQWDR